MNYLVESMNLHASLRKEDKGHSQREDSKKMLLNQFQRQRMGPVQGQGAASRARSSKFSREASRTLTVL